MKPASLLVTCLFLLLIGIEQHLIYYSALFQLQKTVGSQYKDVNLRTIDSFQGGEHSVVILDFVVTKGPGFLSESNRLNVALSRARHGQFVITGETYGVDQPRSGMMTRTPRSARNIACPARY